VDDYGQTTAPAMTGGWKSLVAGYLHTRGVTKLNSTTRCWGGLTATARPTCPSGEGLALQKTAGNDMLVHLIPTTPLLLAFCCRRMRRNLMRTRTSHSP
jgi:hypothetical protein